MRNPSLPQRWKEVADGKNLEALRCGRAMWIWPSISRKYNAEVVRLSVRQIAMKLKIVSPVPDLVHIQGTAENLERLFPHADVEIRVEPAMISAAD